MKELTFLINYKGFIRHARAEGWSNQTCERVIRYKARVCCRPRVHGCQLKTILVLDLRAFSEEPNNTEGGLLDDREALICAWLVVNELK
jgi:hypothetical protein